MALRAQYVETVTLPLGPGGSLTPVAGVATTIYNVNPDGSQGAMANAYANITGSTPAASLVTDSNGIVSYYLDPGEYFIVFADQQSPPRLASFTRLFSSIDFTTSQLLAADQPLPIGSMDMYIASTDPVDPDGITRWLVCDGRPISRVTYVTLFDLIGTEYGSGDGSTTFNIPDFRQRFPLGMKQPTGQAIRAGQTSTNSAALGEAADIVGSGAMDHAHGIPALSIPTFHVLIPANPIPDHYHTLDGNGGACVEHALGVASGMPPLVIDTQACGFAGGFTADHELDYSAAAGSGLTQIVANTTGGHEGVALYGHTADVIGAPEMPSQDVPVSGLFANNGVSGAANGPYLTVNFKIKVL